MICALIGDRMVDHLKEDQLERQLRELIEQEHISMFIFGYFGLFERSALRVIKRLQRDYDDRKNRIEEISDKPIRRQAPSLACGIF